MQVMTLEYAKLQPFRSWRVAAHGGLGWILLPLRYLDLLLFHARAAGRIGNHCYLWLGKRPGS